jgi:archaeal flagellar protein FlaI
MTGKILKTFETYELDVNGVKANVGIVQRDDQFTKGYEVDILNVSPSTRLILSKIRDEFISKVNIGEVEFGEGGSDVIRDKFKAEINHLIKKYFPAADDSTSESMINYLLQQNIGFGDLDILLKDAFLEEIVVNSAKEPVWVYHKKHGWLQTNILLNNESKTRHYSTIIGRDVGKDINVLNPLLDAHLLTGDRVNATLQPISTVGNTITIRKFAEKPWTITDFINAGTINFDAAAFIWLCMQNELSTLIAGGTGSGKTSTLNVLANFFPPNQRIISIEDTREITLPKTLHWVPMETRNPNPEGKGGVSMLDLVVNSLRMRPDRILVGEIRRKEEAEVLFEAMHTGHSVYGTIHANNAEETIMRLTNPPINIPKAVLPALSLLVIQNRNRRTGQRRTLQVAEINGEGDAHVLMQLDVAKDKLSKASDSKVIFDTLNMYTGMSRKDIDKDLKEKVDILKWLVKKKINDVHEIGHVFANYYTKQE